MTKTGSDDAPPGEEDVSAGGGPLGDFGDPADGPERSGASAVLAVLVLIVVVLGAGYVWAAINAGDRLPPGTQVAGVGVGGLEPAQAEVTLRNGLATEAAEEVALTLAGAQVSRPPSALGLSLDYSASIEQAVRSPQWLPTNLWRFYTGGDRLDAVVDVDRSVAVPFLNGLVDGSERAPVEGQVIIRRAAYEVTEPVEGTVLDRDRAIETLRDQWLDGDVIELPLTPQAPDIDSADVRAAVEGLAEPLVQGPVRLSVGSSTLRLRPREYTDLVSLTPVDGELALAVNEERLPLRISLLLNQAGEIDGGSDAQVVINDGLPEVIASRRGQRIDPDALVTRFRDAVLATEREGRVLEVPLVTKRPGLTTAAARDLEITEQLAEVTVAYPAATFRDTNLALAAAELDGTVVRPGESLSFNDTVGPPTSDRGFVEGPLYDDGQAFSGAGAGLSRLASALTSAAWQSALDLEQRTAMPWHPEEYPIGVDASVQFGSFDLVVTNPSPYGVLVTAEAATDGDRSVTVGLWSTPWREVRTSLSSFTEQESPVSEFVAGDACVGVAGQPGFNVTATRTLLRPGNGNQVASDDLTTSYRPLPNIVCVDP